MEQLDNDTIDTQDEGEQGPKPKPKSQADAFLATVKKKPVEQSNAPSMADQFLKTVKKKDDIPDGTGAGAVGGKVGDATGNGQSSSTENNPDPLAGFQRRKGGDDAQLKKAQQQGGLLNLTPQQHFNAKLNSGNLTPDDLKNLKETDPEKYTELAKTTFPDSGDAFLKSETGTQMLSDNLNKKAKETNFIEAKDYDANYYKNLDAIIDKTAAPVNAILTTGMNYTAIKPTKDINESRKQLQTLIDADRANNEQIDKDKLVNWVNRVPGGSTGKYQVNQTDIYDVTKMSDAEIESKKSIPELYNQLISAKHKVLEGNQKAAAFYNAMTPLQNQFGTNLLKEQRNTKLPDPNKDGNDYVREIGEEIYKLTNPKKFALYQQAGGYDKSEPYRNQKFNSQLDGVNKEIMTLGYNAMRNDVAANGTDSQYANIYDNLKHLDYKFSTPKEAETKQRIAAALKAKGVNPSSATAEEKDEVANTLPLENQQVWYNKTKQSGHTDLPNTGFLYSAGNSAQKTITNIATSGDSPFSLISPINWATLFLGASTPKEYAGEVLQEQMESDVLGENPESRQRYDELKSKQDKGNLTIPESYELKDLSKFTNIRSVWDKFKDGNGNMVGMIAGVTLDALPTLGAGAISRQVVKGAEALAAEQATAKGFSEIPLLEDAAATPKTFAQKLGVPQDTKSLVDFAKNKNEMFVIMHHDNAKHAMELFPDDDTKKAWYTGITDVVSLALPNLLPTHKLGELFNSETKSAVATLVDKLNTDNIDKAVIDNLMKSTAKKIIEKSGTFLVGAEKSAAEAALTMSLMTLGNNVTQSVLDPESMKGGEVADNFLQTFSSTFMDSQLLGIIGGKGALQKKYGQVGVDAIYDATNSLNSINSVKYTILDQQSKGQLTDKQVNEKISLLNTAADLRLVVDNLQKEEKLNPNQTKRVFVNLLNEAILKDQIRTLEKGKASELLIAPKQKRVDEINAINKKIVGKEVYVNDNYTVFTPEEKAKQDIEDNKFKQPEEKTFTDFDKTLFHEGKLTELGQQIKDRIAKGEDITILTARKDTPENRKFISETLDIPEASIKMGLDAEGKAAELTAHTGKKVFYDDNSENVKAAQQTDARVVNTGLSAEQQIVMDNADDIKSELYKSVIKDDPTAENADEILKAVSDQWHDVETRSKTERDFPKPIVDAAKKLYPQESNEGLSVPATEQSGKDVVVDEGVVDKTGFEDIPEIDAVPIADVKGIPDYTPDKLSIGENIYYSFDGKDYHKGEVVNQPSAAKPNVYTVKNENGVPTVIIYGGERTNVKLKSEQSLSTKPEIKNESSNNKINSNEKESNNTGQDKGNGDSTPSPDKESSKEKQLNLSEKVKQIEDVTEPYDRVLQHFANDGKIHSSAIEELFGGKDSRIRQKASTESERRARISLVGKDAPTIDRLAHDLWESDKTGKHTTQDYKDAIERVLGDHNSKSSMAKELVERYDIDAAHEKYLAQTYGPETIDIVNNMTDEQINHLLELDAQKAGEDEIENYIDSLNSNKNEPVNEGQPDKSQPSTIKPAGQDNPIHEPSIKGIESAAENPEGATKEELIAADRKATELLNDAGKESEPPENIEPTADGEIDENGVRISKAGLKAQSNFSKDFDRRGGEEVAAGVMETLQRRADAKGITVQEQAAHEVSQMKGRSVEPTEHNIITAGTHLLDLTNQLKKAVENNDLPAIERITELRNEANSVLRQLGNNAGRNLGLFNLVMRDADNGELSVIRANVKNQLGVEDFPETIEALKKSNLTSGDKKKIEPYVAKYEQIVKERDGYIDKDGNRVPGYIEKSMKNISALEDADVQKAIQEAHELGKKEGMAIGKDKPAREKKSQQLRDIASRLRTSDEMDKFLNRAGGFEIEKSGIDLGSYKEIIANILDGVADITEGAEKVGDFIKNAIDKVQGVDKDKLLRDVQTIISRSSLPDKAETIADINKIAENENAQTITKTMVEKGLIKNVVDDVIHSDVPYDKVIETATEELKQHLPNVTKADVADAYVRRNEFAPDKKSPLENTVRTKSEDVKRITNKEHRLAALEAGEDYHNAETKEAKQKVRSDYEQSVDSRIKELEKQKVDAEKQLKEPKTHSDRLQEAKDAVQDRIDKIRTEIADRERVVGKEKLPLHEDVELGRLKEVEKALTSLRDKYLPEQPKMFADEKALKKRRVDLTNDISELNDQINKGERKEKKESTLEDTEHIKTLREIKKEKQELLDKVAPDYDKIKKQADKESAELKKKIADIEAEKKYVNDNKKVFERAIVTPHVVNDLLKAAREERDKTYAENGLRVQKNGREPIRIEREYQGEVQKVNNSDLLTDKEKEDKLAELKQQRDLDLQGTHQGVLSHLADDVQDLKNENVETANNSDPATAQKLNDLNKKLDSITEGLQPTGENLEDMATKAYGKINDLLADKEMPKDVKEKLQEIKKDFENNNQLTSDQLATKAIKKQWEREIKTAQTKINSGNFTELPTTPFDFRRSIELSNLDRQRQNTTKQLNNLQVEAREKNKTMLDKIMDFSTKMLVSGYHTVLKVAEAGAFKPVMDTVVESTTGRLFSKLTNTPKTTLAEIKQATRQYYAFKNKAAAEAHIVKLQDAKLAALDNLDNAIKGGNEAEIKKAENAFKKADLAYGISTLYHSIDANSLKTFWEYVAHGATDLDEQVGKGLKKDISDYRTKLGKAGYVLDGWVRTHGALKTSLSARNEIVRSYASTLKYMQDKGMELNEQNLALAHLIAVNDFEYGRLSNKTAFSTLISKGKTHKSQAVRAVVKTLAPVSTIAINITKRGIDYSTLGAEGWVKLANAVKEGNRINEVEGKVYDTWMQKYADGIKQIPLQERKYINGIISRGLFGAGLSLATLYGLSTGNIKYGGTYDDKNKRKVYGADGELLQPNEWEFWGWKAPKLVEHFINHLPEMLPLALTSDIYEINQLDKKPAYLKTVFGEIENRLPFMTLLGLVNRPAETLTDRFTRVPLASEIEKDIDPKDRENKTIAQKLKNNFGLGFLNPEKGANGYDVSQSHFKALKELGVNAPTSKEIDQYKIEEDAAHPTGQMTKEEGEAFKNERTRLVDEGLKKLYEKGIKLQRKDFGVLRIDLQEGKEAIQKTLDENGITWEDFDEQLKNKKKAIVSEATKKAKKVAVPNQTKANQMTSTIPDN